MDSAGKKELESFLPSQKVVLRYTAFKKKVVNRQKKSSFPQKLCKKYGVVPTFCFSATKHEGDQSW